jgi:hypothetical protein
VKLRLSAAFLVLLLAIAAAGCGSSSDSSTSSAAAPRAGSDAYILGPWHGELHEKGMPAFAVSAHIRSLKDPKRNTVAYTLIRCGGNWTYRGFEQGAYRFLEMIDRGAGGTCKGAGQVTLIPRGRDAVRYEFRGGGVISRGTLRRSG